MWTFGLNKTGLIAKISIKYVLPTCIWKYFWRISRYFAGPRPREISEALNIALKYNKINHSMAFVPASGITKRKPEKARSIIKFYKIYEIFIMTLKVQSWLSSKIGSEQCYFHLKCFSPLTCTHRRRLAFVTCLEMCGNGWKIISMAFVGFNRICSMTTFLHPFLMESTTWSWYVVSNI